jgi:hypothetical protein
MPLAASGNLTTAALPLPLRSLHQALRPGLWKVSGKNWELSGFSSPAASEWPRRVNIRLLLGSFPPASTGLWPQASQQSHRFAGLRVRGSQMKTCDHSSPHARTGCQQCCKLPEKVATLGGKHQAVRPASFRIRSRPSGSWTSSSSPWHSSVLGWCWRWVAGIKHTTHPEYL